MCVCVSHINSLSLTHQVDLSNMQIHIHIHTLSLSPSLSLSLTHIFVAPSGAIKHTNSNMFTFSLTHTRTY